MPEFLKAAFDKFDIFIILAAVILFGNFDYENLSTLDKIYMASFAAWGIMKLIRIYILYNNESNKK